MAIVLTATDTLVTNVENKTYGINNFGTDNKYPNNTVVLADNSAALKRVMSVYCDFVFGQGINADNKNFWKRKINANGLRVDQLLRRMITEYGKHKGFAIQVVYNAAYEKEAFIPLPFECFRLAKPDDMGVIKKVKYYKDWSGRIYKDQIIELDVYNPDPEVIEKQAMNAGGWEKWHGQIFYYGDNGEVKYPHNFFHAALEDVVTDIKAKNGRNANVSTNFMASHAIQLPFTFEDYANETNQTPEQVETYFKDIFTKFQSADNAAKLILIDNGLKDRDGKMIPWTFDKLELQNYDGIFEKTELTVADNIRGQYRTPEILINTVPTGFSTEIMESAYNFYNNITSGDRQIMEETMMELFSNYYRPEILPQTYEITKLSYI